MHTLANQEGGARYSSARHPIPISNHITNMMYGATFNPETMKGTVITNLFIISEKYIDTALGMIEQVAFSELCVSPYYKILNAGENVAGITVEPGSVAIATMCSITLDSVLSRAGIPVNHRGGGIIQVIGRSPTRFTDFLSYSSTTIDPMEVLIGKDHTSVMKLIKTGSGRILANMREVPMTAREAVEEVFDRLEGADISGVIEVGGPNSDVFGISVSRDKIGIVIAGGTNPAAALIEEGIETKMMAMSCLMDVSEMSKIM